MNEFNTYELAIPEKKKGKAKTRRVLAIIGYILFFAAVGALLAIVHLPWMIAILPIFEWMLIFFTWPFVAREFEYSMTSGVMTFTVIGAGRTRRKKLELFIKDFKAVKPVSEVSCAAAELPEDAKCYSFVSEPEAQDMYCAVFYDGERDAAVFFEATEKALKILRFYNPSTVVTKVSK